MITQKSFDGQRESLRALLSQLEAVASGARHQELLQRAEALITEIRRKRAALDAARCGAAADGRAEQPATGQ